MWSIIGYFWYFCGPAVTTQSFVVGPWLGIFNNGFFLYTRNITSRVMTNYMVIISILLTEYKQWIAQWCSFHVICLLLVTLSDWMQSEWGKLWVLCLGVQLAMEGLKKIRGSPSIFYIMSDNWTRKAGLERENIYSCVMHDLKSLACSGLQLVGSQLSWSWTSAHVGREEQYPENSNFADFRFLTSYWCIIKQGIV